MTSTGSDPLTTMRDTTKRTLDAGLLDRLHAELVDRAERASLLDLAYRRLDSPIGSLLLVATERGLIRLAFETEDHDRVLADLAETVSPRVLAAPGRLDEVARELEQYFAGARQEFDLPLDWPADGGFRRTVQGLLPTIGYGRTVSYSELAQLAGRPTAVRAVGSACATNPLPIVVPCHRVLRSDGSLGGYAGGLAAKRTLLDLEAGRSA